MNKTTDPSIRSFLPVPEDSHFPIQNLPYGVFQPCENSMPRIGVPIGDWVLDLSVLESEGFFSDIFGPDSSIFAQRFLNSFMARGPDIWSAVRRKIHNLLEDENPLLREKMNRAGREKVGREHSLESMLDKIESLYAKLEGNNRSS